MNEPILTPGRSAYEELNQGVIVHAMDHIAALNLFFGQSMG